MADIAMYELPKSTTMQDDDYIVIVYDNQAKLITKDNFLGLFEDRLATADQVSKINKIIINGNGKQVLLNNGNYRYLNSLCNTTQFNVDENNNLIIEGYHTHTNQTSILDKFSLDTEGGLLFDEKEISSTVIENWTANTSYEIGDMVISDYVLYQCKTAHTSGTAFEATNWDLISNFTNDYKTQVESNTENRHTHTNKTVIDGITSEKITSWDNKSTFSGSYDDLTGKPTIPTTTSQLTNDSNFVVDTAYVHTDNNYNSTDKTKVNVIVTNGTGEQYLSDNGTYKTIQGATGTIYTYIKYSATQPTQDSDMSDTPNDYMGVYTGSKTTAPTTYTSYDWYKIKGEQGIQGAKGDKGDTGESGGVTLSADITLSATAWDSTAKTQTITATVDTTKLNTPIPSATSLKEYANCGIFLSSETATGYTFTCDTIPANNLVLKIKSEVIASDS